MPKPNVGLIFALLSMAGGCALARPNTILSGSGYSVTPRSGSTVAPKPATMVAYSCTAGGPTGGEPAPTTTPDTVMISGKALRWIGTTACALGAPVSIGSPKPRLP